MYKKKEKYIWGDIYLSYSRNTFYCLYDLGFIKTEV